MNPIWCSNVLEINVLTHYVMGAFWSGNAVAEMETPSDALLSRLRSKFPDCFRAHLEISPDTFVSMGASGKGWNIHVTTRESCAVEPPNLVFVLQYGRFGTYYQEVNGSVADAEIRMCQIISDMRGERRSTWQHMSVPLALVATVVAVCGVIEFFKLEKYPLND